MLALRSGAARTVVFILLPLAFLVSESLSQIIIREKISINPTSKPELTPMAIGSREWDIVNGFCWKFFLNPDLPEWDAENEYRWLMYGDDGYVYDPWTILGNETSIDFPEGGELVHVINVQTGDTVGTSGLPGAKYRFRLKEPHPAENQVYIIYRMTQTYGEDVYVWNVHTLFIRPTFVLTSFVSPFEIQSGGSASIRIDAVNNCFKDPPLPGSALYTASITVGSQYGDLVNTATGDTSDVISNIAHVRGLANTLWFIANGDIPGQDTTITVRIESTYPQIQPRTVSFTLKPDVSVHHFNVTIIPDTVLQADSARIYVQAKDVNDNDVALPDETDLAFLLDTEGVSLGTLLGTDGSMGTVLSSISYASARNGEVRFVANSGGGPPAIATSFLAGAKQVTDPILILGRALITVFMNSDANKNGEGVVTVRKKVKIRTLPADTQLRPLGDADNKMIIVGTDISWVIDFKKTKSTSVTVFVTDAVENPIPNYPFTISAHVRPNSGGHDHSTNRPTGSFVTPGPAFDTVVVFQGVTDPNGLATYKYFSSGFAGVDSIFVRGMSDKDTNSATILLKMGDFGELTDGEHYDLIGAYGEPGVNSEHRKNHYGRANLRTKLVALADSAYADSSYVLRINDMSLELGGPFDIHNNWNTPHKTHREGVSVDIDDSESGGDGIDPSDLRRWLKRVAPEATLIDEDNHFHATIR